MQWYNAPPVYSRIHVPHCAVTARGHFSSGHPVLDPCTALCPAPPPSPLLTTNRHVWDRVLDLVHLAYVTRISRSVEWLQRAVFHLFAAFPPAGSAPRPAFPGAGPLHRVPGAVAFDRRRAVTGGVYRKLRFLASFLRSGEASGNIVLDKTST